jgi:hypothetical protein
MSIVLAHHNDRGRDVVVSSFFLSVFDVTFNWGHSLGSELVQKVLGDVLRELGEISS